MTVTQAEVDAWRRHEFGLVPDEWTGLILAEEAGEVCRAILKAAQDIRGGRDRWLPEIRLEAADVAICLLGLAEHFGFSLTAAVDERWATVSQRRYDRS